MRSLLLFSFPPATEARRTAQHSFAFSSVRETSFASHGFKHLIASLRASLFSDIGSTGLRQASARWFCRCLRGRTVGCLRRELRRSFATTIRTPPPPSLCSGAESG